MSFCFFCFFFSSRRRHTRWTGDWSSDVCSSDLTSGKEAFSAGADLSMLEGMNHRYTDLLKAKGEVAANQMLFDESRKSSLVFRSIETSGKPWAAAINGLALGGAF